MPQLISCSNCRMQLSAPDGTPQVMCPNCRTVLAVPAAYSSAPPAAPPTPSYDPRSLFAAVDRDRSGEIDAFELQAALSSGGWKKFDMKTVHLMISIFDRDRSGTIGLGEFEGLWKNLNDWRRCFDSYDRDRSGTIDFGELTTALKTFGYSFSPSVTSLVFSKYDRDKSRSIGFDEFIQLCCELSKITNIFRYYDTDRDGLITLNYEQFLSIMMTAR